MYTKGTTLIIDFGTFCHYGISDGLGRVIHNSKKRLQVAYESEAVFSAGNEILISEITSENLSDAVEIAKEHIGTPYHLLELNCEHFVRLCHGLEVKSLQIQTYLLSLITALSAIYSQNPNVEYACAAASLAALCSPKEENPYKYALLGALYTCSLMWLAS